MAKTKGTPDDIDHLFERDIIDEDDYAQFWSEYWREPNQRGRDRVVNDWLEVAATRDDQGQTNLQLAGTVTKIRLTAIRQAESIGGRVVRRDRFGRFSKRGHSFQAIRYNKQKP
jgi:hypothetical protein